MSGEHDLAALLAGMRPELVPGRWVFTTTAPGEPAPDVDAVVTVRENEGLTRVVARADAERLALPYDVVLAQITLRVHSALEAVGLTAALASCLAERGISANVVAGFFHDHVFVPEADADLALAALRELSARSGEES
ncbi:MAG: ACT domain-containing protein [Motilibacteraceae bacterium]